MLYLEDYLEMIEHLPNELRDRFTEMREIDLGVENTVDNLEARQKTFFQSASRLPAQQREEEYNKIKKDYNKVIDESNEKLHIAEDCYGLVDRYLRKLDQELHKFQLELEADNRGITEVLEKRSLELDAPSTRPSMFMKENRVPKRPKHTTIAHSVDKFPRREDTLVSQPSTFPLEQMGAGSSAIAAAASQALAATHYNVPGRRSSSLKASFEAISQGIATSQLSIGQELASAATSALAATSSDISSTKKQKIKQKSTGLNCMPLDVVGGSLLEDVDPPGLVVDPNNLSANLSLASPSPSMTPVTPSGSQGSDQEWNYDPNEPRYCVCNQVSYGDMVACDNEDCPYEWFHYPCVGITAPPKGKWYCAPCTASMKRRGRKI
ncbi:inhibitor of growth protein 3 isoform X2 [Eurytemora carolleeae]|uniref:inhibitor of growth protein 3 isoform X2 n=1 Tax=Eurytemora carolleeae TaxID=1294199 RepID=UPI000C77F0D1|nr:inhibitor of growth protein 3 isoform X2 [Eurytemora carolleeae]|eukprot:XP_023332295.1 inhibitor of growth protein 3-like isoform X2 [Eurytemora affinis]